MTSMTLKGLTRRRVVMSGSATLAGIVGLQRLKTVTAQPVIPITQEISTVEHRLQTLELALPTPWQLPVGVNIPAAFVRVYGKRVLVSGHVPLDEDGTVIGPFGRVGAEVSLAQAQEAARLATLAIFASLKRAIGNLDQIAAWLRVYGMVNSALGFYDYPQVMNSASRLIRDVFGDEIGNHSRVAIGVSGLPWNVPVEIEAELELK
jgi:enamine deaminase RidA (YjgF/YER057c/UK114 family)